jgi:hypothetical protein
MHTMLSSALPPALNSLVILGLVTVIGLLFLIVKVVSMKPRAWKGIAERFPMRDVNYTSDSFKKQAGNVGDIGSGGRTLFDIRLATEGVCVYPAFARRNPCLIPWSAIRRVSVTDARLLVVINYERTFEFFLPIEALPTFQARLSPQLFQKAASHIQEPDARLPAWCWLVMGALCISLAIFGLVFDDMNGGPNEGSIIFWLIFGFMTLSGILLIYRGFFRIFKAPKENDKA